VGQRIGDYEVVARLGAGGLGVVYEVQHLISGRREAMKILLPDQTGTPEMEERFRREVQTLATLNHVNIAQLHTAFYYQNQLAMVMELVHGETLRDLRVRAAITLPHTLAYVAQVLDALAYAHRHGVVHRDIKPSNIMISEGGVVKLLDFGIAVTGVGSDLTRAGYLLGSLNYMSPEQIGGGKAGPRSDIYSVGVTLYELLTGELPIKGANNYEIMMAHINQVPVRPHEIAPMVPLAISDTVMRALAKDPAQRFPTAEDFHLALRAISAPPETGADTGLPRPITHSSANMRAAAPQSAASNLPGKAPSASHTLFTTHSQQPRSTASSTGLQNLSLEEISRRLAVYIGPVAKFVIKKLAAQSEDHDWIYHEAAKQIPSDSDRAAFLKAGRS
jgi:serine/threonine-protein kinase